MLKKCENSRRFLCKQSHRPGLGCMTHHTGTCLFIAVGTNRTMMPQFSRDGFPEQLFAPFQPMTETCNNTAKSEFDETAEIKGLNYLA